MDQTRTVDITFTLRASHGSALSPRRLSMDKVSEFRQLSEIQGPCPCLDDQKLLPHEESVFTSDSSIGFFFSKRSPLTEDQRQVNEFNIQKIRAEGNPKFQTTSRTTRQTNALGSKSQTSQQALSEKAKPPVLACRKSIVNQFAFHYTRSTRLTEGNMGMTQYP